MPCSARHDDQVTSSTVGEDADEEVAAAVTELTSAMARSASIGMALREGAPGSKVPFVLAAAGSG